MKISEILKNEGYKNDTYRICEFLGFEDTNQLKSARFFSEEESYSPTLIPGISMSNGDMDWRVCRVVDEEDELYSVDHGYKITLEICDGSGRGRHRYYQSDFLQLLEDGIIIPYQEGYHIEHIKAFEPFCNIYLVHEFDTVVKD